MRDMRQSLQTVLAFDYGAVKFARLRQANWLLNNVVAIQRALSHSRRQGYLKDCFDTGR